MNENLIERMIAATMEREPSADDLALSAEERAAFDGHEVALAALERDVRDLVKDGGLSADSLLGQIGRLCDAAAERMAGTAIDSTHHNERDVAIEQARIDDALALARAGNKYPLLGLAKDMSCGRASTHDYLQMVRRAAADGDAALMKLYANVCRGWGLEKETDYWLIKAMSHGDPSVITLSMRSTVISALYGVLLETRTVQKQLEARLRQAEASHEAERKRADAVSSEKESLRSELDAARAKISSFETQVKRQEQETGRLRAEVAALSQEELKKRLDEADEMNLVLQVQVQEQGVKLGHMESCLAKIKRIAVLIEKWARKRGVSEKWFLNAVSRVKSGKDSTSESSEQEE